MLKNTQDLLIIASSKVKEFEDFFKEHALMDKVTVDHIGLKCSSKDIFESTRALFEQSSRYVYQSIISKRRIAVIGLMEPMQTSMGYIAYLELSDQKPDNSQTDVLDHLEVVPQGIRYEELIAYCKAQNITLHETGKPHHSTYDIKLTSGFIVKLSRQILIEKIKIDEMI